MGEEFSEGRDPGNHGLAGGDGEREGDAQGEREGEGKVEEEGERLGEERSKGDEELAEGVREGLESV